MTDSTRQLTAAIRSGEPEAFERFYREWFDRMYLEARRATGRDESFCLDVVQEAMMKVIGSIKPIDTEPALHGWLKTVVRSCAYDMLRQQRRRVQRERNRLQSDSSDGQEIKDHERIDWLRRELARLDGEAATLISLRLDTQAHRRCDRSDAGRSRRQAQPPSRHSWAQSRGDFQ